MLLNATLNKRKIILLILVTFILKLGLAYYFSSLTDCQSTERSIGHLAQKAGDTIGYIGSFENFIQEGNYYFWNGARKVYAGRMPYYGAPYYIIRQFFSKTEASDIYVIVQIFLDSLANIFFALLCFNILNRKLAFGIGYFIYFVNFNLFSLDLLLIPESLSLSLFVFFLFAYHRYWNNPNLKRAIIASVLLAVVTVLKPYLAIVYLPFFLSVLKKESKRGFSPLKQIFYISYIIGIPLILLLVPWIIRNEIVLDKFIPTQENMYAGYNYTESDFAFRNFVGSWGGDLIYWTPEAAGCYYSRNPPVACSFKIPEYALTKGYSINDMEDVRKDYLQLQEKYSPELDQNVVSKFNKLTDIYKSQNIFMYYIGSRFLTTKHMFWHTNNYNVPINPSFNCYQSYQLLFKVTQFGVYILALTIGVFGLFKLGYERKISLIFITIPILVVCFFAYFKLTEARYFNHAYSILLLGLVETICWAVKIIRLTLKLNQND